MTTDENGNVRTASAASGANCGLGSEAAGSSCIFENFSLDWVREWEWELWPALVYPLFSIGFPGCESKSENSNSRGLTVAGELTGYYALGSLLMICVLTILARGQSGKIKHCVRFPWNGLPTEIQGQVIAKLQYEQVSQLQSVSKTLRDCIQGDEFLSSQTENSFSDATLSTPYFYVHNGVLNCAGYDASLPKWRRLPPLDYLPDHCNPNPDLYKQYLVATHSGVVVMNVSKSPQEEKLIVFNLLSRKYKLLPPLKHRRNPVLLHLLVDAATQSFIVIVAGSSRSGDEHLSRVTELFDSRSWTWKRTGDLPGPDYALNDYQTGVFKGGDLYCTAFLDQSGSGRGILRYNLTKGTWLKNWTYPSPLATASTILQLVENRGIIYLFSEQESTQAGVEHCIDRLEWGSDTESVPKLVNVVRNKKTGGRSLETYPEYVCVGWSASQLCVHNAIDHSGVVYDVGNNSGLKPGVLEAPTGKGFCGEGLYSLNPLSFPIQPSFRMTL